jgi:hypothetical protein
VTHLGVVPRALEQEAAVGQDAGERVVDLVRNARRQPPERRQLVRLVDLVPRLRQANGHLVERGSQLAQFVVAGHRNPVGEIARRDGVRGGQQARDRATNEPVEEGLEQQTDGEDPE